LSTIDANIFNSSGQSRTPNLKDKVKKWAPKNPYYGIIDTLPKEIQGKIDWKKENLEEMFKTLTPPNEYKPGLVLKWLKRVSENEIKNIHSEMVSIRVSERSLRRQLFESLENWEPLTFSNHSQKSEDSDRNIERKKLETSVKTKNPNKIINFNGMSGENNSACSKTSSNTKASPNMVRITSKEQNQNLKRRDCFQNYMNKIPSIVSIDPGKTIILKFKASKGSKKQPKIEVKWKKNIFNREKQTEIFIENLDEKGTKKEKDMKEKSEVQIKQPLYYNPEVFQSIGEEPPQEYIQFNWNMDSMNQEANPPSNYLKPEVQSKFMNLEQSNISQIMESAEGCGDFDMSKPLLSITNEQAKNYQMGGTSILNQFCNNPATPIFSINEDIGDNIRPNILESVISQDHLADQPANIPHFMITQNDDIMMHQEF